MDAEKYLERVRMIDAILINRLEDHRRWVEVADSLGGFSIGERVQSSPNLQRGAAAIDHYLDLEREMEQLRAERQRIIGTLQELPYAEYDILYSLYVQSPPLTFRAIAYKHGKSYDWVKKGKRRGLELLQKILDESAVSALGG